MVVEEIWAYVNSLRSTHGREFFWSMQIRKAPSQLLIALAAQEYSKSIDKSKDIMEHCINLRREEGVTTVPLWTEPQGVPNIQENAQETKVGPMPSLVFV